MGLFGGGKKLVIGLDVGSYGVRAVALQPNKGRLVLQGYSQARIGDDDVGEIVKRVMDQLGVKSKSLVTSVSGRSVIVRQVETPRLDGNELRSHMTYEADKYIPFSADEVVMDCHRLPDRLDGDASKMDVVLVAVRRGFVEDHVQMLMASGAHPEIVDVDIFALTNAWWTLGPQADEDGDTVALVDIGASKSWVAIVKGQRLLFQREIYLAGNEITDAIVRTFNESPEDVEEIKLNPGDMIEALLDAAMPAFEDLANEIRLSFDYVEGQFDQEVDKVVLTGGSALLPMLPDMLGNILGRPTLVFDPLSGVDLITSRYDLHSLEANAPSLTVALGLACHAAAADDILGLGGMQAAAWQSRRAGGNRPSRVPGEEEEVYEEAAAPVPAPADQMAFGSPAPPLEMPPGPPPEPMGIPEPMAPAPVPEPMPAPAPQPMMEPPPASTVPEVAAMDAPAQAPVADFGAIAPPDQQPPPSDALTGGPSGEISSITDTFGKEGSAMLVVLDDDDDDDDFGNPSIGDLPNETEHGGLPPLPGEDR